jgi:hypothetical protein
MSEAMTLMLVFFVFFCAVIVGVIVMFVVAGFLERFVITPYFEWFDRRFR